MNVMLRGVAGLLGSRKGAMSLLVLISINVLAAMGRVDGTAYAAVCTVISGIFCFTQSRIDQQSIRTNGPQQ